MRLLPGTSSKGKTPEEMDPTLAKVVAVNGNSYRVLVNGVQVTKDYPAEVRRLGAASAGDHAQGQYRLGDRVQVRGARLPMTSWVKAAPPSSKTVAERSSSREVSPSPLKRRVTGLPMMSAAE